MEFIMQLSDPFFNWLLNNTGIGMYTDDIETSVFLACFTAFYSFVANRMRVVLSANDDPDIEVYSPFTGRWRWFSYSISVITLLSTFINLPKSVCIVILLVCVGLLVLAAWICFWTLIKALLILFINRFDMRSLICFLLVYISVAACVFIGFSCVINALKMYVAIM